ncbi:hypothetical protein DMUE_3379 [Dictyocoela muelleri]|nr:hypothetical protein DMUE_3379 [Dictyocoela muelleri]
MTDIPFESLNKDRKIFFDEALAVKFCFSPEIIKQEKSCVGCNRMLKIYKNKRYEVSHRYECRNIEFNKTLSLIKSIDIHMPKIKISSFLFCCYLYSIKATNYQAVIMSCLSENSWIYIVEYHNKTKYIYTINNKDRRRVFYFTN